MKQSWWFQAWKMKTVSYRSSPVNYELCDAKKKITACLAFFWKCLETTNRSWEYLFNCFDSMILVFGRCGIRATVFVRCLLDFLESLGLHVFHRFYRWCFFFSRWDVRQVDVVPSHVQNLWQWWRWSYWKRGWFSRKQRSGNTFMVVWSWAYQNTSLHFWHENIMTRAKLSLNHGGFIRGLRH